MFLPGYLSLCLLFKNYLFVFKIVQELHVHPCRPPGIPPQFPLCRDVLLFSLEKTILEYHPLGTTSHGTLPSKSLVKPKSILLKCRVISLNSNISWSLQPRLSLSFTLLTSNSFLLRTRPNITPLLYDSSITCSKKLSFMCLHLYLYNIHLHPLFYKLYK